MGFADVHGRARTDGSNPQEFGVCDGCGEWNNLINLRWEMDWRGNALYRTGFRKCYRCFDLPQPQLKVIFLPPDPIPVREPRVEPFLLDDGQMGFDEFYLDTANPELSQAQVLQAAEAFAAPVPLTLNNYSGSIAQGNVSQLLMGPNSARNWLMIYNPTQVPMGVSQTGPAAIGASGTLMFGSSSVLLMSIAQTFTVYAGALNIVSLLPATFYAWDSP